MRITISGPVIVSEAFYCESLPYPEEGEEIEDFNTLQQLTGASVEESGFYDHLDVALIEIGVSGAVVSLQYYAEQGCLYAHTHFWAPRKLSEVELNALQNETEGQWSDGVGEGGLLIKCEGKPFYVFGTTFEGIERGGFFATQVDDGLEVPGPPLVALYAHKGMVEELRELLDAGEDPNQKLQGFPALHRAIIWQHVECVKMLLEYGADPNITDDMLASTPLSSCAMVSALSDEVSMTIAKMLVEKGADSSVTQSNDWTAADYAESRGKTSLWAYLKSLTQNK